MKRTLLIDGDVVAFQAAAALEECIEWEENHYTWHVNFSEVINRVQADVCRFVDELDADDHKLCLTDPKHNFRLDVLPSYKGNRRGSKRPLVLMKVKEWMIENMGAKMVPTLEGDDVMGILATAPSKREQVILSIDKDMKTIPCVYVRDLKTGPVEITGAEADKNWLKQTLSGDVTDGYTGCPTIGKDTADTIIEKKLKLVPYEHTLTRGPRKGQTVIRYEETECDDLWEVVVSRFQAQNLGVEEAITQARVARILRYSDYDFKKGAPILWRP